MSFPEVISYMVFCVVYSFRLEFWLYMTWAAGELPVALSLCFFVSYLPDLVLLTPSVLSHLELLRDDDRRLLLNLSGFFSPFLSSKGN